MIKVICDSPKGVYEKMYAANPVLGDHIARDLNSHIKIVAFKHAHNGEMFDLQQLIQGPIDIKPIYITDPEALDMYRHDCEHVMAQAVQELFPQVKLSFGAQANHGFGYDFYTKTPFTWEDVQKIEQRMHEIIDRHLPIHREVWSYEDTVKYFHNLGEFGKTNLLKRLKENHERFTVYQQGEFIDLCTGPHGNNTKHVGHSFKLMKLSGVQSDLEDVYVQRITGTHWLTQEELDKYLYNLEEAQKRDHRKLALQMDLYHMEEHTPGMIFWHPNGWSMIETLKKLIRTRLLKQDYQEVNTPCVINAQLWKESGHWDWYRDNMFCLETDNKTFAVKPMSCPAHIAIFNSHFKNGIKSYNDLPLRMSEFGIVHRNEEAGAVQGLKRARCFTQDDGHIFCTIEHVENEIQLFCDVFKDIYGLFDFQYTVELSTRPEKRLGDDATWDKAEAALQNGAQKAHLPFGINEGDGAFYGPKLDFHVMDSLERKWQCSTVQLDFMLPERLKAKYVDRDGVRKTPIMIHRAIFGSIERFVAVLLEHTHGWLPMWLAPVKIVFIPLSDKTYDVCHSLYEELKNEMSGIVFDNSNKRIGEKKHLWRDSRACKAIIIGNRDLEQGNVTVQDLKTDAQESISMNDVVSWVKRCSEIPE